MDDYSDIDYSSESDVDHGLAEEYEAAKLLAAEGNVVEAMDALKTIMDLDEKSKWGFKACKRLVKLAMQRVRSAEELPSFLEYYRKLFPFINSNGVGANDAEKALDSLWTRFCSGDVEFSAKHQYCLFTWRHLESRCSRITRMKWAARLSNHCVTDRDYADIDEGMADELEQFIDRNSSLEDANECFMRSVFDALLLVAHLNFRRERHEQVHIQLEQLRDIAGKTDVSGESRGALKELNARVFVATGQYGKASELLRELLDNKAFLAAHPVRYPRICSQLRLLAPLVPSSAVFRGEDDDIVGRILHCYTTNDKAGLLAAMEEVAVGDDSSAVVDICNVLARNMTFPRMSSDAWIDVFACLERYDVDSALLVGRRLSVLVADIAHRLPLRVITDVSLLGEISYDALPQHVYEAQSARTAYPFACLDGQRLVKTTVFFTQMSADNGRTAKGRSFTCDHSADQQADDSPLVSYLRCAMSNSFIERFDLLGSFPMWTVETLQTSLRSQINIQRLNYAFATQTYRHFAGALQMLPLLGVIRVRELSMDTKLWDEEEDACSYLTPLGALNVTTKLTCRWARFPIASWRETAFLQGCFADSESPASRHIIVKELWVRPELVARIIEHARYSTCKNDVHLEVHLVGSRSSDDGLPEIGEATDYVWEVNRLCIKREEKALIAWYSWQGTTDSD